jgi:hypothetical protein
MALAWAIAGAPRPSQVITWLRGDNEPENLTGATMTGKILSLTTGTARAIVGALSVMDGEEGRFSWEYDAADVAAAGRFMVQFTATFDSEPSPARTIASEWFVYEAF